MQLSLRLRRAVPIAATIAALAPGAAHAATVSFDNPGDAQAWTVPAGITSVTVDLYGSAGESSNAVAGGDGAHVQGSLAVTPGETLQLFVGDHATNGAGASAPGDKSRGGGATDVRRAPYGLEDRLAVAGGGGGAGGAYGGSGGDSGASGVTYYVPYYYGTSAEGGGAGTQTAGGAGGRGDTSSGYPAADGALGVGGYGGTWNGGGSWGGGGGGGYYGGGGGAGTFCPCGANGGGGGGGSSLVPTLGDLVDGENSSLGRATITYDVPPPVNTAAPRVTGSTTIGGTLTTTNGSWEPTPDTFAYRWQSCDAAGAGCTYIVGETSQTYTTQSTDQGHTIRSVVTATNGGGKASKPSATTKVLTTVSAPVNTSAPKVTGSTMIPGTLTTTNGDWDNNPEGFAYRWQHCDTTGANCADVANATSATYTTSTADAGYTIRSVVTATNGGGKASKPSATTKVLTTVSAPVNTSAPKVTGSTMIPGTLTTTNGDWDNNPEGFAYRWQHCDTTGANCADVANATSATYTTSTADAGYTIRSVVTATNGGGKASKPSATTKVLSAAIAPVNTKAPKVTGGTTVGDTLTSTNGTWDNAPTVYSYVWQRCSSTGTNCETIADEVGTTYTTTAEDAGYTVRSVVYAANAAGRASKPARPTGVITQPNTN